MDNGDESERRKAGPPIERWILVVFSGAALAFTFYESGGAYLDGIRTDVEQLTRNQAVYERDLEFARAETAAVNRRMELVESRCADVRERLGKLER